MRGPMTAQFGLFGGRLLCSRLFPAHCYGISCPFRAIKYDREIDQIGVRKKGQGTADR